MGKFTDFVANQREQLGLNKTELAKQCNKYRDWIYRLESGKTNLPRPESLPQLSAGLEVEIETLIDHYIEDWQEQHGRLENLFSEWFLRNSLKAGLTIHQLSKKSGISYRILLAWVNAQWVATLPTLKKALPFLKTGTKEAKEVLALTRYQPSLKETRIGMKIHKKRLLQGLSLRELAKLTKLSREWLSKIENGHLTTWENFEDIGKALDIDLDLLREFYEVALIKRGLLKNLKRSREILGKIAREVKKF